VTKFLVDYLLEDKMTLRIYGNQDLKRKKRPVMTKTVKPTISPNQTANTTATSGNRSAGGTSVNTSVSSVNSGNNYKLTG